MTQEALKLALEALKQIDEAMPFPVAKLAQTAIEKALAQPEQEPVGWLDSNDKLAEFMHKDLKAEHDKRASSTPRAFQIPVYTSPPQRKPLTEQEICSVLENLQIMYNRPPTTDSRIIFARAIEAAHGIKENT